ncbi:MFS transporter [Seonamhaeicola aphaedonensis]|uniref:MFS transporter n=1 Tax=Seonamhaeicola aphaedonensis TaxID=1461338 RepID=A0A3D9HIU4_9FLAO|nr:MFS transporter [Seonamhaeicola aphaedonensis]RED49383.1 MFS transporter [Seonamhaeicola aphaedonensis]
MDRANKYSFIEPKKSPVFYGYVILFFGTIGVLASIPGQTVGVSVFTDPVKDALGLTRNQFSNAYMIGTLSSSLLIGSAGKWFDIYGSRFVAFFAALLLGFSLILCSFSVNISETFSLLFNIQSWFVPFTVMTMLFFLIRFSGQGVITMASRNMIMLWFDKNRGKVNSISSIAVSLGFSISPIVFSYLIDNYGWEKSWQILALCLLTFSIFIMQFYRDKPEDFNLIPDGFSANKQDSNKISVKRDFTLTEAKKTRAFWIIGFILAFNSFFITGFTFHVVSIFESQGFPKSQAIAVFVPISIIAIIVSTLCNILSDYIKHRIYILLMIISGFLASFGLLFLSEMIGVYLLILGCGVLGGLFAVVNAVTWPKYFGRKHLGAITGKVMSFLVVASAIAPTIFSYSYSSLGTYEFISLINMMFLTVLFIGFFKVKNPQ